MANQHKDKFLDLIRSHQAVIVVGGSGSGKTSQVPQWCLEVRKEGRVGCTEPKREAAVRAAEKVAEEMGTGLGDEVGFTIRDEDKTSKKTILKYMTDGQLVRELKADPKLGAYQVILLDEVQERSEGTEELVGVLKELVKQREELKVVIMSSTLEGGKHFQKEFGNAPLLDIGN